MPIFNVEQHYQVSISKKLLNYLKYINRMGSPSFLTLTQGSKNSKSL